jgi:hypothetical protein
MSAPKPNGFVHDGSAHHAGSAKQIKYKEALTTRSTRDNWEPRTNVPNQQCYDRDPS